MRSTDRDEKTPTVGMAVFLAAAAGLWLLAFLPGNAGAAAQLKAGSITAGQFHSCAIRTSGQAVCWGLNGSGQLGDGTTDIQRRAPTPVSGLGNAVSVTAGDNHTCAVRTSGQTLCWGKNDYGQLGNGATVNRNVPVVVSGLTGPVSLSAGAAHTCAVKPSGQALCWGFNLYGRLGDNSTTNRPTPVAVAGLADAKQISAGSAHTCAVRTTGQAVCWGRNDSGRLGNGSETESKTPVAVSGLTDAGSISAGLYHSCAVRQGGQALCWGANDLGQVGDGTITTSRLAPTPVAGLNQAAGISAGAGHSCAVRTSGEAVCWGFNGPRLNEGGQLGNGTTNTSPIPVAAQGMSEASSIAAGSGHTCAIRSGEGYCWGENIWGQVGDNTSADWRLVPTPIALASGSTGPPVDCPPGWTGAPPECTEAPGHPPAACPEGQPGTPPDCVENPGDPPATCPDGRIGTPAGCVKDPDRLVARARLGQVRVTPRRKALRRGRKTTLKVRVANLGSQPARAVKICARPGAGLRAGRRCVTPRTIMPGASTTARFRITVRKRARPGVRRKVRFRITGPGLVSHRGTATIRIRR